MTFFGAGIVAVTLLIGTRSGSGTIAGASGVGATVETSGAGAATATGSAAFGRFA